MFCCGRALAQEDDPLQEVDVQAQRQTALESQALAISETPNAGPHLLHPYAIIGLGPLIAPAYDGSMKTKVSPFLYLDVRGLFNDRVFVSDLEGIGVKLVQGVGDRDRSRFGRHDAGAEGEGEQIPQRDRAFRRDGIVQRAVRIGEHGHVRQFREELVDRIVEAQRAVLDEKPPPVTLSSSAARHGDRLVEGSVSRR